MADSNAKEVIVNDTTLTTMVKLLSKRRFQASCKVLMNVGRMTRATRYLIVCVAILLCTQEQILPTNASLTLAKPADLKLTSAQKQAKLAQSKLAQKIADQKKAAHAVKAASKTTSKNSSENDKLIQDFLTAAKKLPDYKSAKDPKSHEKEVEKVFEAYKKMQTHVKEISLTKSQEKEIRKAANNLFDYKIGEGSPIKHMAWKGYKAVPESAKTTLTQPSKK